MLSVFSCGKTSFSLSSSVFFGRSVMSIPIPLARVLEAVPASLLQANPYQTRARKFSEALENLDAEIFRRRHAIAKNLHIFIQVLVIEWLDDLVPDVIVQIAEIRDHPRGGIYFPRYGHLHEIVVPVTIGIVALAINTLVLGIVQMRAVQPMRSRQRVPPRELQPHRVPSS